MVILCIFQPLSNYRSTGSTDDEMDDHEIQKLLIVTQASQVAAVVVAVSKKHLGGDRTGNYLTRAQMTTDIAQAINDGLYFYEQVFTGLHE